MVGTTSVDVDNKRSTSIPRRKYKEIRHGKVISARVSLPSWCPAEPDWAKLRLKERAWIDVKNRKDRPLRQVSMRVGWDAPAPAVSRRFRNWVGLDFDRVRKRRHDIAPSPGYAKVSLSWQ